MTRRTTIAYLLISIILLPLMLSTGLQAFQQCVKLGVANRLATENLVIVSIPLGEVKWMEEGREIMVDGKMFDIKHYEEKDGCLLAEGVYDQHETAVVNLLNHFGDREQEDFIINMLLLTQSFIAELSFYSILPDVFLSLDHFVFYLVDNAIPFLETLRQPPR